MQPETSLSRAGAARPSAGPSHRLQPRRRARHL